MAKNNDNILADLAAFRVRSKEQVMVLTALENRKDPLRRELQWMFSQHRSRRCAGVRFA